MVELATHNYEINTDKAPSQHHLRVIKRTFQELSSRTMGQSIRSICPNFMSGNYADDDLVFTRNEVGPFSRNLKTIHQDAIRLAIENPDRGGISWIGHRAFDEMRTALDEHLGVVDKNGDRSNQITWIKNLKVKKWINSMTPGRWFNHLDPRSKVAKSMTARLVRTVKWM